MNATLNRMLYHLKQGRRVLIRIGLNYGICSRHQRELVDGMIHDFSYVDDSTSVTTIEEFIHSFYGKAFKQNAVEIERSHNQQSPSKGATP